MAQIIVGSILILLIVLFFGLLFKQMIDPDDEGNTIWVCPMCDITTRKMALKLFNKTSDNPSWKRMKCPHCEHTGEFDRDNSRAAPLSPVLSIWERRKIDKTLRENISAEDVDKQIAKYLEIQEKKLEQLKEEIKKGE